jgi:hypothetical protein
MNSPLAILAIAALAICPLHQARALTASEQADHFHARGKAAATRGEVENARLCYTLAQRSQPGHAAAQRDLRELDRLAAELAEANLTEAERARRGMRAVSLPTIRFHGPLQQVPALLNPLIQTASDTAAGGKSVKTWAVEIDERSFGKGELAALPKIKLDLERPDLETVINRLVEGTGTRHRADGLRIIIQARPKEVSASLTPPAPSSTPLWISKDGRRTAGEFVGLDGEAVVIKRDGKEITIPFSQLDPASVRQAKDLGARQTDPFQTP